MLVLLKAKLGESNKFYYDEKLKRWVEEGAEQPAEETALPPPPTTATFQNGPSDYNLKNAMNNRLLAADSSPGIYNFISSYKQSWDPSHSAQLKSIFNTWANGCKIKVCEYF